MKLNKYKLGQLIKLSTEKNKMEKYGLKSVKGISIKKEFIETKADMEGVSLKPYLIVKPDYFAYVPITSRNGEKITLAHNDTNETYIVSSSYIVFYINRKEILDSDYLFMFFNRLEFDRLSRYNSWGSAREAFSWSDFSDIEIELPRLDIQRKYVKIYQSMLKNQKSYAAGLDELKFVCDSYIDNLRKDYELKELDKYIEKYDERNKDNIIKNVKSVSTSKEFREPTSKVNKTELSSYKIVHPRDISFVQTTHNEKVFANAINNTKKDIVVTSVNEVFTTKKDLLLPEYLVMFFNRTEFDRYARFHSWGSARETFTWNDLIKVKIPIPSLDIQQSIINIYNSYIIRKKINEKLKEQIKIICPILIKGAIEEAKLGD